MRHESPERILLGVATGAAFGAALQRGGATDSDVIERQLLLRDHHVAHLMATAAASGAVGTHALEEVNATEPSIKPLQVRAVVIGGVLFGAGMALLGYCPGTSLAAAGEGRRDAMWGVLGMLAGSLVFVRLYPHVKEWVEEKDLGKRTLPSMTRTSPWPWVAGLVALVGGASGRHGRRRL